MPETGWLYWLDSVLIAIAVIVYIALVAILIAISYLERHMNEITDVFKSTLKQILSNIDNLYRLFWEYI